MRIRRTLAIAAAFVMVVPQAAHAQRNDAAGAKPNPSSDTSNFILRTYEVGDLVVSVPDYATASGLSSMPVGAAGGSTFGGGGGGYGGATIDAGGGGVGRAVPPPPHDMQITFDSLIDAIISVVSPHTWTENGGGHGEVQPVGAALAVWQTPEVHQQIAAFLDMLRQGSAKRRTLAIDARWLMLNSEDLGKLVSASGEEDPKVDRKLLDTLTRRPTSMRGMTHCFSGQLVYLISGTRRNIVSSYIPVVGSVEQPEKPHLVGLSDDAPIVFTQFGGGGQRGGGTVVSDASVGYQPIIEKPNFGVLLEIRPTVMQGEDVAVVDLKSTVTFPAQPTPDAALPSAFDAAMATPRVDRLAVEMQELATTLRLPLGQPVLIGGMTYLTPSLTKEDATPPGEYDQQGASLENPQLYLVLELR